MQFNLHVPRILERWLNNVNISKRNCMVFIHVVSQQFLLNFVQSIIFRSWRLSKLYFFFYKGFFIKNSNPLWKHDFLLTDFYNTTLCFHKSVWEQNYRALDLFTNNHYTNVIKSTMMAKNLKHGTDAKHRKHRKTKH